MVTTNKNYPDKKNNNLKGCENENNVKKVIIT